MKWKSSATVLKSESKDGSRLRRCSEVETSHGAINLPGHDNKDKAIKINILYNTNRVIPPRLLGVQSFKNLPFIRGLSARD